MSNRWKTQVIALRNAPKGWDTDPEYVYIGRKGKGQDGYFGNPFVLSPGEPRGATIDRFRAYAKDRIAKDPEYRRRVAELDGKTLVCFCAPRPCHGDVLADLAAELRALGASSVTPSNKVPNTEDNGGQSADDATLNPGGIS